MNTMIRLHLAMISVLVLVGVINIMNTNLKPEDQLEKEHTMTAHLTESKTIGDKSVGAIVAEQPAAARIFEKYRIDYCCQGKKSLRDACRGRQVELGQVAAELATLNIADSGDESWLERSLSELCDHIERRHHDYLRTELPRLAGLIDKVVQVHGDTHADLVQVRHHFQLLRSELEPHMFKEERVLFPAIRQLESTQVRQNFEFGSVDNPIHCMIDEHEHAGEQLGYLRQWTADYTPPAEACTTWRVMLHGLEQLEHDMHEHVHKENSILFPRAQELERRLAARTSR